jgi:hypothetical protein
MPLTKIDVGTVANDNTGDTVRASFQLTNLAFDVIDAHTSAVVLGTWDASAGTFPSGTVAGKRYRVTVGGTVDTVTFEAGDIINALVTAASTTVYADNWQIEQQIGVAAYLGTLPSGTILDEHGGDDDSLVPGHREDVGAVAFRLGEGAFMEVVAEAAPGTVSDAAYTIQPEDFGKSLHFTHAAPAITIAAQVSETYPDGFWCLVYSDNAATITCATGVTGNGSSAKAWALGARPDCAVLIRESSDAWSGLGALI